MEASTTTARSLTTWQQAGVAILFVIGCLAVGFLSGTSGDSDSLWYWSLRKPFFQPPSWLFGPVWTLLYTLMGVAAFLVWREGWRQGEVQWALMLFLVQLGLNAAWTPVFFGAQAVGGALIVIILLVAVLVLTVRQFLRVNRIAGFLMMPYLAWVAFATLLNAAIWILN
jgi:translocator protein